MSKATQMELTTQTPAPRNDVQLRAEIIQLDKLQKFTASLNRKPAGVIEETIDGKKTIHVPISVIENTLRRLYFGQYQITLIDYRLIVNEIVVHARIEVMHPVTGEWLKYDGIGSVPVQQYSGSKIQDFMQTKIGNALHKNVPAAYAFAIKNAAKKIGKIFGADINRKHEDQYKPYNLGDAQEPLNS